MSEILVIGATGKTGRRIVPLLLDAGHGVRAASRNPSRVSAGTPVRFDWDDASTHDPALNGVDAVYVVPPELRLDHADDVIGLLARARDAGVRRAVFLSVRGVEMGPDNAFIQIERALPESGLEWTVLRPTWFSDNFTEGAFAPGPHNGFAIVASTGDGRVPFIAADDIAAVAAAALSDDGHHGQVYELSGPEALSFGDAARILGDRTGKEIPFVDMDATAYAAVLTGAGLPADYAALLTGLMDVARAGHDAHLSDGVHRALGRDATSFDRFAAGWAGAPAGV